MRAALVLLVLTSTVGAQERTSPPAAVTTGRVSGRVVTEAGLPLAGAAVAISSSSNTLLTAASDANGVFDFPRVPADSQRVIASKSGFFLGGPGAGSSSGRVLTVRAGEAVPPLTLTMSRGGAVTGRIVDEFGDPIEQLLVNALRHSYQPDGRRVAIPAGVSDLTDDRGEFRVYGLTPGDYVVVATVPTADRDPSMTGFNNPAAPPGQAPTYYPGTLDIAEAQSLSLGAGQERSVHFAMRPARTFRISGTVTTPTGAPATGILSVAATAPSSHRPQTIAPDGSFTLDGMAPGDYLVQVLMAGRGGASGSWPVSIGDADVTGLTLSMTNGTTLRGRLVFEGRPFAAADAPVLRLLPPDRRVGVPFSPFGLFASVDADGQFQVARDRIRVVRTGADGRFRIEGVRSGSYVLGVVEELEQNYQFSPDFQQRLRLYGDRFSIAEGEAVNLELKLTSGLP
jgi:hypothetical protein